MSAPISHLSRPIHKPSTGGRAPRKQLATKAARKSASLDIALKNSEDNLTAARPPPNDNQRDWGLKSPPSCYKIYVNTPSNNQVYGSDGLPVKREILLREIFHWAKQEGGFPVFPNQDDEKAAIMSNGILDAHSMTHMDVIVIVAYSQRDIELAAVEIGIAIGNKRRVVIVTANPYEVRAIKEAYPILDRYPLMVFFATPANYGSVIVDAVKALWY